MEDLIETLTRGNVAEVKVVLASVAAALGIYQVALMVVCYGKVRLPFLGAPAASGAHRAIGDALIVVVAFVALACLTYYGLGEAGEGAALVAHAAAGIAVLVLFSLKVLIVRRLHGLGSLLPFVGGGIFIALAVVWATVVPEFFGDGA